MRGGGNEVRGGGGREGRGEKNRGRREEKRKNSGTESAPRKDGDKGREGEVRGERGRAPPPVNPSCI